MLLGLPLLLTLAFSLNAAANPIVARDGILSLPLTKRTNTIRMADVLARDRARAKALKSRSPNKLLGRAGSVPATNQAEDYVVSVGIGSPPTYYTLLVDTGSSNTWVGADKAYVQTSASTNTGDSVSVSYGSGSFSGTEYTDTVALGDGLTIKQQSIGVASQAQGFSGVDGIIGIGPADLTEGTVSNVNTVPTVTDNLYSQNLISENLVAISFEPATSDNDANGELTFGGTDSSKYTGSISYVPLTSTSPASEYWGIDQSVTYGKDTTIMSNTAGIVDTGTTLVLFPSDAFSKYQKAVGATEDEDTGLLRISSSNYDKLDNLYFNIGDESYALTPNAQIWPRSLNSAIGGNANDIYLVVSSTGEASGQGLDFINGYAFLERYYSVFDTGNSRVGFATTSYTDATSN